MRTFDFLIPIISIAIGFSVMKTVSKIELSWRWRNFLVRINESRILSNAGRLSVVQIKLIKECTLASFGFLTGLIGAGSFVLGVVMAVSALFLFRMFSKYQRHGKAKLRRASVIETLPDFADMVAIAIDAGLSFDRAAWIYCQKFDNSVSEMFRSAMDEIEIGKARRKVFIETAEKSDIDEVRWFIAALLQTEKLGTSLAEVLRDQAKSGRAHQKEVAQELSATAPVKMLFPIAGLILPSLLIVIIGPAFLHFLK